MTDTLHDKSPDDEAGDALLPWEHWEEHDGEPVIVWDEEAHAAWCKRWAPRCPDGSPQRLAHPLGFRERSVGELELRVALGTGDHGVCEVIVDEHHRPTGKRRRSAGASARDAAICKRSVIRTRSGFRTWSLSTRRRGVSSQHPAVRRRIAGEQRPAHRLARYRQVLAREGDALKYAGKRTAPDRGRKADLIDLPDIADLVSDRRVRFVVFSDDLTFDADEPGYTSLKVVLDGTIAATSPNVLIYATSNRRHLMPEYMSENLETKYVGDEIHPGESVEEKISLSERFGLWVSFYPFDQDEYLAIVRYWLSEYGVADGEEARREALQWALQRGSRSGRIASQFARGYAGAAALQKSRIA